MFSLPPLRKLCRPVLWAILLGACQAPQGPTDTGFNKAKAERISGYVRLSGESWNEKRVGRNSSIERNEMRAKEEVMVHVLGFWYHPKLMEFDLQGLAGLEQRQISSNGALRSNAVDARNLGYDLHTRWFKELPYSLELYSLRNETQTRQAFFDTTEAVITESGFNLDAHDWYLPSRLHYHHYRYQGRGLNDFNQIRDNLRMEGRREDEDRQLSYSAEFNDVSLANFGLPYKDYSLNLGSTFFFDEDNRDRWYNGFSWRGQTGSNTNSNLDLNSNYHNQLSESLAADMSTQYTRYRRGGQATDTLSFMSGLSHQLFSSLHSSASLRYSRSSFGGSNLDTYGARVALDYRKKTAVGPLDIQQSFDVYTQDRGALQGTALVLDESHVYNPGTPIILAGLAVDHASVVVTDDTGLIIYQLGSDYTLLRIGSRTRIDIPVTSLISPGQTILVDYSFQPTPEQKVRFQTVSTVISLGIMDRAELSVGRDGVDQTLLSGFDDGTLEQSTRSFASVRAFPVQSLTLGGEYEQFKSNIAPFRRRRVYASYQEDLLDSVVFQAAATAYRSIFENFEGAETGRSASAGLSAAIARSAVADLRAEAHRVRYRTDRGSGYLLEADLRKNFRRTVLSFQARYTNESFLVADDQRILILQFIVTRNF